MVRGEGGGGLGAERQDPGTAITPAVNLGDQHAGGDGGTPAVMRCSSMQCAENSACLYATTYV